jgi:hypothetical protein
MLMQIWKDNFYKTANAPLSRQFVQTKHAGDANLNYSVLSVSLFNPSSCTPASTGCAKHTTELFVATRNVTGRRTTSQLQADPEDTCDRRFLDSFYLVCHARRLAFVSSLSPRVEVLAPLLQKEAENDVCRASRHFCLVPNRHHLWTDSSVCTLQCKQPIENVSLPAVLMGNKRASRIPVEIIESG